MKPCLLVCSAALALLSVLYVPGTASAAQTYAIVTSQMGISVPGLGSGAAWGDLDGDGDQDLLVSTNSSVFLYRNDGTVFTDVTASSGLSDEARNFAVGDYDRDGLDDVVLISFGYIDTKLYRNLGGLQFDDVSDTAGIYGTYWSRCAWTDYDDDGDIDLFGCGMSTSCLFQNQGDGTFLEVAAAAGIQASAESCAWLDYDNDGREDCYTGRSSANHLYHNQGDGTFAEVGAAAGVNDPYDASGVCSGDFDGDGFFDLYTVNIASPRNTLYRNNGDGTFEDVTTQAGVADVGDGRTATFIDIDSDGLVDIFSSNHVNPNRLYHNNGNGTFTDIATLINIQSPPDPFGTGFADFDGDGDLDVFLATHFGNELLQCSGVTCHWVKLTLVGTTSNTSAIGAVVYCAGPGHRECMRVDGGHGMGDLDSRELVFGLGAAIGSADIQVIWPSGLVEYWDDLTSDSFYVLVEGTSTGTGGSTGAAVPGPAGITVSPNPAGSSVTIHLTGLQGPVGILIYDTAGRLVLRREVTVKEGSAGVTVPVDGLQQGIYFVTASGSGSGAAAEFVVVE
jgi:hypothetical protein